MLTKPQIQTLFNDLTETASALYEAELEKGDKYDGYADPVDFVHELDRDATNLPLVCLVLLSSFFYLSFGGLCGIATNSYILYG